MKLQSAFSFLQYASLTQKHGAHYLFLSALSSHVLQSYARTFKSYEQGFDVVANRLF